jgi:hypothetical protein
MSKFTITCTGFTPYHRNTLRGFATIRLPELKLTIHDVAVHQHDSGARWVALPSKPLLDKNGIAKRGPAGKIEYAQLFEFEGRAIRDAFSAAVVRALLEFEPHAFDISESVA